MLILVNIVRIFIKNPSFSKIVCMKAEIENNNILCNDLFLLWRLHPTKQLDRYWENYLTHHPEQRAALQDAVTAFDAIRNNQAFDETALTEIKESLDRRIRQHQQHNLRRIYLTLSAAVLVLALVTTLFFIGRSVESPEPVTASIGQVMTQSVVQLLTGDQSMAIGDHSVLDLSEKENRAVIQGTDTQKEVTLKTNQNNRLIVPYGKRSSIVLADGTKAFLNSGTVLDFPSTFPSHAREIRVEGEIFLEVSKQEGKPFIIHTPQSEITVYGTSFNVSSYSDENRESVVLVSGSVKVRNGQQELFLKPSEIAILENGTLSRNKVDVDEYTCWKNGYLKLSKTPLSEVLIKIGRYYNIAFQFPQELHLDAKSCSGKLFLSDNLDDVLQSFSRLTELTYEQNGETILIKPNA